MGGKTYTLWFPQCKGPKSKSPHTYLVEGQEMFLLFRSVLVGAVIQKKTRNAPRGRVFVVFSGLRNGNGELLGYLMGLYKYKCHNNPIWSDVYDISTKKIVVYTTFAAIQDFFCDITVTIPGEAVDAHKIYLEGKRWHEEGCYDAQGVMKDNRFITFDQARAPEPT